MVNFWGSWCPPCVEEMPALQAVHHELGNQVRFVGIDLRISGTPTTSFISHGELLDFHEGRVTKAQLLTYVRQIFGVSPQR